MIRILKELKKSDPKMYQQVIKELDTYGGRMSKHYVKLTYPDFLDLISYCNSYTFSPNSTEPFLLDDLNQSEHEIYTRIRKANPQQHKIIQDDLLKLNNRCRQRCLTYIKRYDKAENDTTTFISNLKQRVFG